MAFSSKTLFLIAVGSVLLLYLCSQSKAASNFDCCLRHTKHILPFRILTGFTLQKAKEACDIDAIIFHTKMNLSVCANPEQSWVKKAVIHLSRKAKRM